MSLVLFQLLLFTCDELSLLKCAVFFCKKFSLLVLVLVIVLLVQLFVKYKTVAGVPTSRRSAKTSAIEQGHYDAISIIGVVSRFCASNDVLPLLQFFLKLLLFDAINFYCQIYEFYAVCELCCKSNCLICSTRLRILAARRRCNYLIIFSSASASKYSTSLDCSDILLFYIPSYLLLFFSNKALSYALLYE